MLSSCKILLEVRHCFGGELDIETRGVLVLFVIGVSI